MKIEDRTKIKFVEMLRQRKVYAIKRSYTKASFLRVSIWGISDGLQWDFTPLVTEELNIPLKERMGVKYYITSDARSDIFKACQQIFEDLHSDDYLAEQYVFELVTYI